ncbi:MAG TPA: hypothetical protein VFJ83_11315 [Nocardioidaceae bacterium]|nr:hypothetical protein [Nocardioidaceae bacterium]
MKVMDPQGRTVRVHRRWLPWRRRVRDIENFDAGGIDGPSGDDPISLALALLGVLLLIPFVLGLVLLVGEVFLLVLLLPVVVLVRVLFRSPWTVEATSKGHVLWSEQVAGWNESEARILDIAAVYERGEGPFPLHGGRA